MGVNMGECMVQMAFRTNLPPIIAAVFSLPLGQHLSQGKNRFWINQLECIRDIALFATFFVGFNGSILANAFDLTHVQSPPSACIFCFLSACRFNISLRTCSLVSLGR